jgi:DNA-binding transcriptional LysR family regulator
LAQIDRTRRVGLVIPNFSVVGAILERTDLLVVLPERVLININSPLFIFPPPLELMRAEILAIWPERVQQDPLHSWFRQLCFDTSQAVEIGD